MVKSANISDRHATGGPGLPSGDAVAVEHVAVVDPLIADPAAPAPVIAPEPPPAPAPGAVEGRNSVVENPNPGSTFDTTVTVERPAPAPGALEREMGEGWDRFARQAPAAAGPMLRITSKVEGFRRAGIAHPSRAVPHSGSDFSDAQLAALFGEPMLVVEVI